jgi:hypothetical protein
MTDDKEERVLILTKEQWIHALNDLDWVWHVLLPEEFHYLPLAPKHTDEEYEQLYLDWEGFAELVEAAIQRIKEQCVIINDLRCELDLAMQRIKELEAEFALFKQMCDEARFEGGIDFDSEFARYKEARK